MSPSNQPEGIIENPEVGGSGGTPFTLLKQGASVKKLRTWSGTWSSANAPYVIRGIQVIWSDGSESQKYGKGDKDFKEFTFDSKVISMTLYAAQRLDKIHIATATDDFNAGGDGGEAFEQIVGNGTLLGFNGAAAWDIDRLGSVFQSDDNGEAMKNETY
ncbi:Mannose-binding lectin [Beauveria brongniartii RCEF 3172]|uniref:Mannose-binding lectin n=1 Tax=Beauveria brongniartii RCEF 3172 TaxID=1081107 RepID=A0A166VRI9_9HYPO|nr:Mannose-binding lectin [Beauveria brongniartii RCEF 3172]